MNYLASGFENVDAAEGVQKFLGCLDLLESLEFFKRYKQQTFDLLQLSEGESVLEVGCGTGKDAISLAQRVGSHGRVVAIDCSRVMLAQAIEAGKKLNLPLEFVLAEAQCLPFKDSEFHSARVDRTLQHIGEPYQAIAEISRVVKRGGQIVAVEPDWETLTVNSENRTVTRRLLNFWCDNFPAGWIGRDLAKYFHRAGIVDIKIFPQTLIVTQLDLAERIFDLMQTAEKAQQSEIVTHPEAQDWWDELKQMERKQEFFCSFTVFIVNGKKP